MDLAVQFFAAFGPLALTVMGLIVSIWPPRSDNRRHWLWVVAFLAVGLPTAISTFVELRGTDELLTKIWAHMGGEEQPQPFRHLTYDQKARLSRDLRLQIDEHYPFQINSAISCDECEQFAQELRDFFNSIPGWNAGGSALFFPQPKARYGIQLVTNVDGKNSPPVMKIRKAFADAGMALDDEVEPLQPHTFVLIVGRQRR